MRDSEAIYRVAEKGGLGIAFNYNKPLEDFLEKKLTEDQELAIVKIDRKGKDSDLCHILPYFINGYIPDYN